MQHRLFTLLAAILLVGSTFADNLLLNPGFEEATSNFLGTRFEDWESSASKLSVETADVFNGDQSAHITATGFGSLYQELDMATVTTGQQYELTIHYKLLSTTGTLSLNSYWESNTAGQLPHDEDSIWVALPAGTGWQTFTTHTTRPADGYKFHFAIAYTKNVEVLLDDFSFAESESTAPWFTISPEKGGTASCAVGDSVLVNTYTIRQGNLTAPVTLEVTGVNRDQWSLTKTNITADTDTVSLYYRPTMAGNHRATLFVDCTAATTYSRTFPLTGTATNPSATPTITLTPATMPAFTAAVGQTTTDTLWVASTGCTDYIHLAVASTDGQDNMFLLSNTQLPQNGMYPVVISFVPSAAGTYTSVVTVTSLGATPQTITLQGTATGSGPAPVADYDTAFVFDATSPLTILHESFDGAGAYRNKTLHMAGWQNVVRSGSRAWWGYTEDSQAMAKATGYVYQGALPGDSLETWLITPALSYNVTKKVFSFAVQGNALYEGQTARLEAYYIDATDPANPYFEHIEALDTIIPANDPDQNGKWIPVQMDLSGIQNAPSTFYIGFRYTDRLSANGSYYYIDDVEWNKIVAGDTLTINVESIMPEPDPNAGTYTFSFVGQDNKGKKQKVQIEYYSESMYGTFTNNDFRNWDGSEGSGSFNYMRPTNSDFQFYPFKNELTATVADSLGATVIDVNGLINVYGTWTRVLLHGVIPAPEPDDTIAADLGLVSVIPNPFLNYLEMHAANSEYSLATGIMGRSALAEGTYYMADLLRPDLVTADGDTIRPTFAELTITAGESATFNLMMDLLGEDNILYQLSMHTGTVEITDTVQVDCTSGNLLYNEIYNMYQFQGQSAEYIVALSVDSGALINSPVIDIPVESILLTMTSVIPLSDSISVHVFDAHATVTVDPANPRYATVAATLLGVNGVCYEVTIPVGFSIMPEAKDTFYIDMGEGVEALRYQEDNYVELRLSTQSAGIDVVFWNYYRLAGNYAIEDFNYESDYGNFMMLVNEEEKTYQFRDIQAAEMQIDSVGDTLHITIHAMLSGDTLYIVTAKMGPKAVLGPEDQSYDISSTAGYNMVGMHSVSEDGTYAITRIQFQAGLTADGELVDGDAALWTFTLASESLTGIGGEYGYSAGTLDENTNHIVYDQNTEIVLKPIAGTLTLTPIAPVTIGSYHTWRYAVRAYFAALNGVVYELVGENTLICVDNTTGAMVEMQEELVGLDEVLSEQGLKVKKVLRNGQVLLESKDAVYSITGQKRK